MMGQLASANDLTQAERAIIAEAIETTRKLRMRREQLEQQS